MKKQAGYIGFKYSPSEEDVRQASDFSKRVDKTTQYAEKRNQHNSIIRVSQATIGKLAEITCAVWAVTKNYKIIKNVDWKTYPPGEKNWASDLDFKNPNTNKIIKIAVKSSLCKYGGTTEYLDGEPIPIVLNRQYTYTIQLKNNDGVGGCDKGEIDKYLLCNWDEYRKEIELYAWADAEIIPQMMIRPFKQDYKKLKGCIMMESCGGLRDFPCGVDELIRRQREA